MTEPTRAAAPVESPSPLAARLAAYHDGELGRLARWRLERRLRRSPSLRRELAELARVGDWVRRGHEDPASPDLWEAIAERLPAPEEHRPEAPVRTRSPGLGWLALPGAVAATAAVAVALFMGWPAPEPPQTGGVVRWLDSGGRDVMVLEGAPDTTIIWVIDGAGRDARRGGIRDSV